MNRWLELTRTALLGTHRAALPDLQDETALGQLLAKTNKNCPEQALLQMAGMLDLYERVGQQHIIHQTAALSQMPQDDCRTCSPALTEKLADMLDGRYRDLLPECLSAMREAGLCLPALLLPDFLEHGRKNALLRPLILPVLGRNGRWLAEQNPNWTYASSAAESWDGLLSIWRDVSKNDRHALLRQLRHTNPALGRALVTGTWKAEAAPNRIYFIRLLETGLSMADEPFLEAALDDREVQVRKKAAELLANLSQSRLCRRMAASIPNIFHYEPTAAYQIVPTFPLHVSDEMVRDGVTRLAPNLNDTALARARSQQLTQIVGAVPLDWWTETWQVTPEVIVQAIQSSRWPRTLSQAFTLAAQRQQNTIWAVALARFADFNTNALKLTPVLPSDVLRQMLHQFYADQDETLPPLHKDSPLLKILRYWPQRWNADEMVLWIEALVQQIEADEKPTPFLRTAVKQLARACSPECADGVVTAVSPLIDAHPGWRNELNDMVRTLRFRREMYNEIEGR